MDVDAHILLTFLVNAPKNEAAEKQLDYVEALLQAPVCGRNFNHEPEVLRSIYPEFDKHYRNIEIFIRDDLIKQELVSGITIRHLRILIKKLNVYDADNIWDPPIMLLSDWPSAVAIINSDRDIKSFKHCK